MFIEIEPTSSIPIYTQLMNELKKAIVKKDITSGEKLPSVRRLAGDLGVNMHTVNKAYNLLVDQGILSKSQQGYTLNPSKELTSALTDQLKLNLEELLVDIYIYDISVSQVEDWTKSISKDLKREW